MFQKGQKRPKSCKTPRKGDNLAPRQVKMLDYYYGASNFCKTDALRRTGYKHPASQTNKFNHPSVKKEMDRREVETREKYNLSYERVTDELMRVAYSSLLDFAEIDDEGHFILNEETLAKASADELKALGEITIETHMEGRGDDAREVKRVRVKPWNKLQALDQLMRHAGLSKEKTPFEGVVDLIDRINAGRHRASSD